MERSLPEIISKMLKEMNIEENVADSIPEECWKCKVWMNPLLVMKCPLYKERGECPWLNDAIKLERERLESIGVPERIVGLLYDGFDKNKAAIAGVVDNLEHIVNGGALLIFGDVGVGKSVAMGFAIKMLVRLMPRWVMRFIPAREVNWKRASKLKEVDVLGVDDLGLEHDAEIMKDIFEYRYAWRKTTIATSNLTADQFKKRYGERVRDRLREWGKYVVVRGRSLR